MKTTLISIPPHNFCHAISTLLPDWKEQLKVLIQERKAIIFELTDMENVLELEPELTRQGYEHQILSSDCRKHFLVPLEL
jgi:hypothetical protein